MSERYSRLRNELPPAKIGEPTTYKELQAWALKMGDTYQMDVLESIHYWAQINRIPGKMKDWSPRIIKQALDAATAQIVKDAFVSLDPLKSTIR